MTTGIGPLRENFAHQNIRESLLGSSEVGSCPSLSKLFTYVLANQLCGSYNLTTELDIIRFWNFPFGGLVWHFSTKANDGILYVYVTVFEPRRVKRRQLINFLVYALVYPSIDSNLVNLAILSNWSESFCMHTCYLFSRNPLLRRQSTDRAGILINYWLALNIFGSYQPH